MRKLTARSAAPVILLIVLSAAWILSFDALISFALAAGIRKQLAWAYPVVVDGQLIAGLIAAYVLRTAPLRSRLYVWALIAGSTAVSIVANAAHASAHNGSLALPPEAAGAASAVPALSLFATLHLVVMIARTVDTVVRAPKARPARTEARKPSRIKARAQKLAEAGKPTSAIAAIVGRSESQVRRLVTRKAAADG